MLPYSSRMARTSRAFSAVALIFALLRITRLSFFYCRDLGGGIAATCAGSKPWNASDAVPLGLDDAPVDPASKTERDRCSREERRIVRCVVAGFSNGAASSRTRVRVRSAD
jgi:hypothetical protein